MYNITKDEALSLLQKMRQLRQTLGGMIASLEHMIQLQDKSPLRELSYNPDDYLEEKSEVIENVSKGNKSKGGEKK